MSRQRTDVDSFSSVMGNGLSTNIFRIYITKNKRTKSTWGIAVILVNPFIMNVNTMDVFHVQSLYK